MTNESQATPTTKPNEGAAPNTVLDGAPTGGEQQQQGQEQEAAAGQQDQATAPNTSEKPKQGDDATDLKPKAPEGAPEKYEFKAPEGVEGFDPGVLDAFSSAAKDLDLPQDKAQQILDKVAPVIQARQIEQLQAAQAAWLSEAKADKEFGGEKLQENLAIAKKAMDTFGSPELRKLLNESGLGNHPELIRAFYRAGKAISEDRFVPSGQATASDGVNAKRLYPNSNMN